MKKVICPGCHEEVREWISTREGYVHCYKEDRGWKKHKKSEEFLA